MTGQVEGINIKVLQECRLQAGFSIAEIEKKIHTISEIENGSRKPTFNQIEHLSKLYNVPRWVFIAESLPEEYQFEKSVPAFRQFADSNPEIFEDSKIRGLTTRIERYRNLIIDLLEDMDESIPEFKPPVINKATKPAEAALIVRKWLDIDDKKLSFPEWKEVLEEKGVFVFLTSKYRSWSNIDRMRLRGLSIYHENLPIIIINNSDAKKAQTFTLFHELGHIIRKENSIDDWMDPQRSEELWCDRFAGNVLMPQQEIMKWQYDSINLDTVKKIASLFKVSPYACLVRLRSLKIITHAAYQEFADTLRDEFLQMQESFKSKPGGPPRNRANEVFQQYGRIFTRSLFQAYYNEEIGLHKLAKIFDLKKASYVFELEAKL